MLGILIGTLVLAGALWLVARHDADISIPKLALISLGISVGGFFLALALFSALPPLVALALWAVLFFGLTMWALVRFVYISWGQAALVTVIYIAVTIGLQVGLRMLTS